MVDTEKEEIIGQFDKGRVKKKNLNFGDFFDFLKNYLYRFVHSAKVRDKESNPILGFINVIFDSLSLRINRIVVRLFLTYFNTATLALQSSSSSKDRFRIRIMASFVRATYKAE